VSVSGATQPATFTSVSGEDDALACCAVDKCTASDFFQVDDKSVLIKPRMNVEQTVLKVGDCINDALFLCQQLYININELFKTIEFE